MTTKTYLSQVKDLERAINRKLEEIYKIKTLVTNITIAYDGDRVQTSRNDSIGNSVAKIVDFEKEVGEIVDKYISMRKTITEQIDSMENEDYKDVLTERYINALTFDEMTEKLPMSRNKIIQHVHPKALIEFERRYGYLYK